MRTSRTEWLLALGAALVVLAFIRFTVPEVGWVVFAPFLAVLHARPTRGAHLAVLGTLVVAFVAAVNKMATEEIPWAPVPMFALPMAVGYFVAVALAAAAHRRLGARWGVYTFAALAVALGWVQYTFTPGSSWGVLAHTQVDRLAFVQLGAIAGLAGMNFVVALGSALAAAAWSAGVRAIRADLIAFALVVGLALLWGHWRLAGAQPGESLRVAAVVSPVTHADFRAAAAGAPVPRAREDALFARSERAASLGARVVVWNEVATITDRAGEAALVERADAFAREHRVALVMAYGVVQTLQPLFYTNKYRLVLPDGTLADEYMKRFPVPGDPNPAGAAHAKVVAFEGTRLSGGICYDYGFPVVARDNAADGATLALVPSSDWRGIDPEHALMARANAVAVGLPMLRPVRAATTIATDAYGRLLGAQRFDGPGGGVMVVDMPVGRVPTLYARTGEVLPWLACAFLAGVAGAAIRARRRQAPH